MYSPASNLWTWVAGSTSEFTPGVYGTLGVPDPQNAPGARELACSWTDAQGNFWMFGGYVQGSTDGSDSLVEADSNDMWEFNPKTSLWTWVGGSEMLAAPAVYGVQGTASATNNPGNRESASTWVDAKGNFWLFGGSGLNSSTQRVTLNDLWEFVPSTGMWTWIAGSSTPGAAGVYGTEGTAAPGNSPGVRIGSASWTDSKGNLVLFGGLGLDASSTLGNLNDVWSFDTATSQWTWLHGSSTVAAAAAYGIPGTAATGNDPGARQFSTAFPSSSGDLWLFGGYTGTAQNPDTTALNDLWKYTP
jgi:N-acetylneuraminic acid mutarotase